MPTDVCPGVHVEDIEEDGLVISSEGRPPQYVSGILSHLKDLICSSISGIVSDLLDLINSSVSGILSDF